MEKRELIRLKTSHIVMIVSIILLSLILWSIFAINKYMDSQIVFQTSVRDKSKATYEKTTYIEKNIEQFYNFVNKSRSFSTISMYDLKQEFTFLIPGNIKTYETELKEDSWKISWQATDFRTIDFISNTLKTYSNLYGTITDVTIQNSTKTSPTNVTFQMSFNINKDKLQAKIYTDDIDWDWVKDFREESINVGGVKQDRKVINDECPFTSKYFVIWKMLEQNPSLLDIYPKYKQMYEDGYLTVMENGCMKNWDYNILE